MFDFEFVGVSLKKPARRCGGSLNGEADDLSRLT